MRLLGAARLSRRTDESTSIERQREQLTLTARVRGDELVAITEDSDVSGAVSPFLREGLGPWLTDPKLMARFDGLIVAKVDRLTRSLRDFDELVSWCDKNGKTLISVGENLDLSTSTGRLFASLLAMFAQYERERMSERRLEAADKIRDNGWWAGFGYPYGTRPVKVNDHWELEVNPDTYPNLVYIARLIIGGQSRSSIAKQMNAAGIPTPAKGKMWRQNTIADIFTNQKCPLEADLLAQVLEALDTTKQSWTKRGDAAMLLNVASCECGAPYYSKRYQSKGHSYAYYDCSAHCGRRRIPMADLEALVNEYMTNEDKWGGSPVFTKEVRKGKSTKAQLLAIERKIRNLDLDDEDTRVSLMAQRAELKEGETSEADMTVLHDTGTRLAAYWPTLDDTGKRHLLLTAQAKVTGVKRHPDGKVVMTMTRGPMSAFVKLADGQPEVIRVLGLS